MKMMNKLRRLETSERKVVRKLKENSRETKVGGPVNLSINQSLVSRVRMRFFHAKGEKANKCSCGQKLANALDHSLHVLKGSRQEHKVGAGEWKCLLCIEKHKKHEDHVVFADRSDAEVFGHMVDVHYNRKTGRLDRDF